MQNGQIVKIIKNNQNNQKTKQKKNNQNIFCKLNQILVLHHPGDLWWDFTFWYDFILLSLSVSEWVIFF